MIFSLWPSGGSETDGHIDRHSHPSLARWVSRPADAVPYPGLDLESDRELAEITDDSLNINAFALKGLQSYVSETGNSATLLFSWRSFAGDS